MADHMGEADNLSELLADALTSDEIETDLLLRYRRDPAALGAHELQQVEAYLAASPAHRDRLRVLTRVALSRGALPGSGESGTPLGPSAGKVVPISSHPRWRMPAAIVGAALAASLALAVLYGTDSGPGSARQPAVQIADDRDPMPEPLAPPRIEPSPADVAPDLSPLASELHVAQDAGEASMPAPDPLPIEPEDELVSPDPALAIAEAPQPSAPALEPQTKVVRQPEPEAVPDEIAAGEPIVIAMNIGGPLLYTPPAGSVALEYLGGLRSSGPGLPTLQALAPTHVGQTLQASPTLYWYSSMETDARVEFVLADRESIDPALELTLESPVPAGIHAVRLEDHGVVLEPGMEYRWFVTISAVDEDPFVGIVTRGSIERVAPSVELETRLEAAEPGERGRIYAEQGLWYDALAFISEGIDGEPEDARLRELRVELLGQAGLREAAGHDRAAKPNLTP